MTEDLRTSLGGYLWLPNKSADPFQLDHNHALGYEVLFSNAVSGPRVVVADSVSYGADRLTSDDVLLAASYAGRSSLVFALRRGLRGVIAHEAGVGLSHAGISGLALCEEFKIPAAAVATMDAGLSHGASMVGARITHFNATASALGVNVGMSAFAAGLFMLKSHSGKIVDPPDVVDTRLHLVSKTAAGSVYASDSTFSIKEQMPNATICGGSHCARVFAESILKIRPSGAIANDAGMGRNRTGVEGLSILDDRGIAAASVDAMSARIGSGLSTYQDGTISACNSVAQEKGVRVGMSAKDAAEVML
jgi:uncharacterized protein YunC (DUF1805 family)